MQRPVNVAIYLWIVCYTALSHASTSFAQDVIAYDWLSLIFAASAGLLGGAARTIFTLVSERALVGNVKALLLKDLVVALIGGAAMYLAIQGYNAAAGAMGDFLKLPTIVHDLRVLLILWAGFSRGRWLGVLDRFASDAIANASSRLRGGAPVDPPPSVAAPLGDK